MTQLSARRWRVQRISRNGRRGSWGSDGSLQSEVSLSDRAMIPIRAPNMTNSRARPIPPRPERSVPKGEHHPSPRPVRLPRPRGPVPFKVGIGDSFFRRVPDDQELRRGIEHRRSPSVFDPDCRQYGFRFPSPLHGLARSRPSRFVDCVSTRTREALNTANDRGGRGSEDVQN